MHVTSIGGDGRQEEPTTAGLVPIPGAPGISVEEDDLNAVVAMAEEAKREDEALAEVVALAAAPITAEELVAPMADFVPADGDFQAMVRHLMASGQTAAADTLRAALDAIGTAHERSVSAVRDVLVASAGNNQGGDSAHLLAALGVIDSFARRPDPAPAPQPDVHVHVPQHALSVNVEPAKVEPHFDLHMPEQPAPAAPHITVNVPEQPAPQVTVAAAPAPAVTVHVPPQPPADVHVHVPEAKPRSVRVEVGPDGTRRYVTE